MLGEDVRELSNAFSNSFPTAPAEATLGSRNPDGLEPSKCGFHPFVSSLFPAHLKPITSLQCRSETADSQPPDLKSPTEVN